ncbi:glycosyltransferase [Pseudalkalibacillus hwajinpoensis]|uniref:Glycosyltransferase n=1 Tax=Guptibacillus hwajinpoensis TaxID=208199 RepID=A0A4V5PYX5_9BACL|nr:glycosyltransferase [Pseudalkalibacillus hwajinpoensis]TKD71858.1 glycosyltransferase [Pseudalkalibacillus hwajinpoensis]
MEKVSIIIPFYNCAYVDRAIKCALAQTYENIEVIVVNDGSKVNEEKLTPFLNKVRYIKKGNGGTGSALNTGIRAATGKYFSWLSSDDLYRPDKVEKQLNFMKQHQASVSYSNYVLIDENDKPKSGNVGVSFPNRLQFYKTLKAGCPINGCTVMMKMDIFQEVGLFDESLSYAQDYDLWLRVVQKYDFHYVEEPLVFYRVHGEMGTKKHATDIPREIQLVRNRYRKSILDLILRETTP